MRCACSSDLADNPQHTGQVRSGSNAIFKAISAHLHHLHDLTVELPVQVSEAAPALAGISSLRSLNISSSISDEHGTSQLSMLTQLSSLSVRQFTGNYNIEHLVPLASTLQQLCLHGILVQTDGPQHFGALTKLTKLSTDCWDCNSGSFSNILALQSLQELELQCGYITRASVLTTLQQLGSLIRLVGLCDESPGVPDWVLEGQEPPTVPSILRLELLNIRVDIFRFHHLLQCFPNLQVLEVQEQGDMQLTATDPQMLEGFQELMLKLGRLQRFEGPLNLRFCHEDDEMGYRIDLGPQRQKTLMQALAPVQRSNPSPMLSYSCFALHSTAARALVTSLPHLVHLDLEAILHVSMAGLAAIARLQHLQKLYLCELPAPAKDSIHLIEALGHTLTELAFIPPTGGLGLLPWINERQAPTFPALRCLDMTGVNSNFHDYWSCNHDYGCVSASDLHYLLHAAPQLEDLYLVNNTIHISNNKVDTLGQQAVRFKEVMQKLHGKGMLQEDLRLEFMDLSVAYAHLFLQSLDVWQGSPLVPGSTMLCPLREEGIICERIRKELIISGTTGKGVITGRMFSQAHLQHVDALAIAALAAAAPDLTSLHLAHCRVDGLNVLPKLAQLFPNLRRLVIDNCKGIEPIHVFMFAGVALSVNISISQCTWWRSSDTDALLKVQNVHRQEAAAAAVAATTAAGGGVAAAPAAAGAAT